MKTYYERPIITQLNTGVMNKFGTKTEFAPVNQIDGVPVSELIREYGSPLFVLSERTIRETYRAANRAFKSRYPKVQFAWSYKTNYINAICKIFHQEGSWAEVVSRFEYEKALENNVPGSKIIFNGPDKTDDDLILAMEHKSMIHIDHLDELYRLNELADQLKLRPQVAIRVNMDTGIYPIWDRFGFNFENGQAWDAINKIILSDKMDLVGLHCHIGTFMLSTQAYGIAAKKLSELALAIRDKFGKNVKYLDLGGGFASKNTLKGSYHQGSDLSPSFDDYAEAICSTLLNAGFKEQELPTLYLETGRALIDDAGYLLGTVISNKRLSDGRKATIVDFGVNIMFTAFWYDHKISPAQEFSHYTENTVIYGPLCMNIDILRENITLPPLKRGDQVVVHRVGAYNITQSMQFISLRPAIVVIDVQGKVHTVKQKEVLSTLECNEVMPKHLETIKL